MFYVAPTGPPTNISDDLLDELQLSFSWDPPNCASRGGEITTYDYTFGLENGDPTYGSTDSHNRTITFTELGYHKGYQFQMRARTSVGPGPYSDVQKITTPESSKPSLLWKIDAIRLFKLSTIARLQQS